MNYMNFIANDREKNQLFVEEKPSSLKLYDSRIILKNIYAGISLFDIILYPFDCRKNI